MTRIFISHSHSDEAIAFKLVKFLLAALTIEYEEILCTSNSEQGLSYGSSSITDQLKNQLKNSEALIVLITSDSLHSAWIPFEAGSFWTTDKPIIPILGPGLTQNDLLGPLKSFLSIPIDVQDAENRLNSAITQLAKSLNLQQKINRIRDEELQIFSDALKAWQSKRPVSDQSQEIEELKAQIIEIKAASQKDREGLEQQLQQERSQNQQLEELEIDFQKEKEELARSLQSEIKRLKEQLAQAKSQVITVNQSIVTSEKSQAQDFTVDLGKGITLEMIAIPGGKFLMGTEDQEIERLVKKYNSDRFKLEKPQHEVTIQPFYMGKYPVTQAQYQKIMGKNPSNFKGDDKPVEQVSWDKAVGFCQKLSEQTGKEYRLPTEAEWEYACRSVISNPLPLSEDKSVISEGLTFKIWGSEYFQPFYFGETISYELANYGQNIDETTDVGKYPLNSFGLYDMHGNVWEWCQDDWHDNYENAPNNWKAWVSGVSNRRVMRGGSWRNYPYFCRSAYRFDSSRLDCYDDVGFRVVCAL